jgi:hypothetical protein
MGALDELWKKLGTRPKNGTEAALLPKKPASPPSMVQERQKCVHRYIHQQNGEACFRKTLSQNGDPQDIAVVK